MSDYAVRLRPDRYDESCARLDQVAFGLALWERRLDVWGADPGLQARIGHRLGWLRALDLVEPHVDRLRACARAVTADGFTDVVLLGMGGSSLGPEVLRQVLGAADGAPRFRMLDSTDPDAVAAALDRVGSTVFLLASKSGSTVEPNAMAAAARDRLAAGGIVDWGSRFIAVTDEGTTLHRLAETTGFRDVFVNPSDIGGRYSVLSYFGMLPASLLGADLPALIAHGRRMERACRHAASAGNPGLALGAFMASAALRGRDKLTVLLPDPLRAFGLWIEQLVAESTGKSGQGVVPVVGEPADLTPVASDRAVVAVRLAGEGPSEELLATITAAGVPLLLIDVPDPTAITAEFFRWQFATAAAGYLLGINPFDEPNVQQAKDATRSLLDRYALSRQLPAPESSASVHGARVALSSEAQARLNGLQPTNLASLVGAGDYVCLLPYLPPDEPTLAPVLERFLARVSLASGCATMLGYGPRYLHSTGQLHKGGPNTGVFIVLTAAVHEDLPVPGEVYSFGVLETAQAIGDFQSLDRTGRRAVHVQLPDRDPARLERVLNALLPP